jgi:hypothetical protein
MCRSILSQKKKECVAVQYINCGNSKDTDRRAQSANQQGNCGTHPSTMQLCEGTLRCFFEVSESSGRSVRTFRQRWDRDSGDVHPSTPPKGAGCSTSESLRLLSDLPLTFYILTQVRQRHSQWKAPQHTHTVGYGLYYTICAHDSAVVPEYFVDSKLCMTPFEKLNTYKGSHKGQYHSRWKAPCVLVQTVPCSMERHV